MLSNEEAPSNATKQKVAAAKQYIEKHYKEQMKNLQERRERYDFYLLFDKKIGKSLTFVNVLWKGYTCYILFLVFSDWLQKDTG